MPTELPPNPKAGAPTISLRDYFAARALQGMLANPKPEQSSDYALLCAWAYRYADQMLRARIGAD